MERLREYLDRTRKPRLSSSVTFSSGNPEITKQRAKTVQRNRSWPIYDARRERNQ